MKKIDRIKRDAETTMEKIRSLTRHIRNVEDNCLILGEKLIERGEIDLAKNLVANGMIHDASKFYGIEWDHLSLDNPSEEGQKIKMKLAIHHHRKINPHHVEFWAGGINDMPDVYLCEMVCDLKARSEEFGTSLVDYIDNDGIKRWKITKDSEIYKKILLYVTLLCQKPFGEIK
jgi:hypothetical protein